MLLILLMAMQVSAFALAEENLVVEVDFLTEDNVLNVSGTVPTERDRIPMTLSVTQSGVIVAAAETVAVGTSEAGIPYQFPGVKLDAKLQSGTLEVTVAAAWVNLRASTTLEYKGADVQLAALTQIAGAETVPAMRQKAETTATDMGVDLSVYQDFSNTAKNIFAGHLLTAEYTLPENADTEENCALVHKATKEYHTRFREAIALGTFFNLTTAAEVKTWYDTYKEPYGFLIDDPETEVDETKMLSYVDSVLASTDYLERRSLMEDAVSMQELSRLMKEQAVLQAVKDSNQYVVREIIGDFPTVLTVDYDAWDACAKKSEVCVSVAGKYYESFADFSDAVDRAVASKKGSGSSNTGGGGSSSGGSRGSGSQIVAPKETQSATKKGMQFTDIDHVAWAEEAISYLYTNGIISGRSEDSFAPDATITRAELAKMLVLGLGLELTDATGRFADVATGAWYAAYVETAAAKGLVQGDETGRFSPDAPVTRQDAATVLYRAIASDETAERAYFEDYETISEYAKVPVDYMCAKGIINGMGDGIFAPLSALTRAQAAKILYLVLVG